MTSCSNNKLLSSSTFSQKRANTRMKMTAPDGKPNPRLNTTLLVTGLLVYLGFCYGNFALRVPAGWFAMVDPQQLCRLVNDMSVRPLLQQCMYLFWLIGPVAYFCFHHRPKAFAPRHASFLLPIVTVSLLMVWPAYCRIQRGPDPLLQTVETTRWQLDITQLLIFVTVSAFVAIILWLRSARWRGERNFACSLLFLEALPFLFIAFTSTYYVGALNR